MKVQGCVTLAATMTALDRAGACAEDRRAAVAIVAAYLAAADLVGVARAVVIPWQAKRLRDAIDAATVDDATPADVSTALGFASSAIDAAGFLADSVTVRRGPCR